MIRVMIIGISNDFGINFCVIDIVNKLWIVFIINGIKNIIFNCFDIIFLIFLLFVLSFINIIYFFLLLYIFDNCLNKIILFVYKRNIIDKNMFINSIRLFNFIKLL